MLKPGARPSAATSLWSTWTVRAPLRRFATNKTQPQPLIRIPRANIYRFGDGNHAAPALRELEWTVNQGENWAVIGSGSGQKATVFQMLMGHHRISPHPSDGPFPFLSASGKNPLECITLVSFGNRARAVGGEFYDYTARYGAVRDKDRITLRQSMFPETIPREKFDFEDDTAVEPPPAITPEKTALFDRLIDALGLRDLLDLPRVALSNGQTRRARIISALLKQPELLLLDEPLTGLDVQSRPRLLETLKELHDACAPHILLGLRTHDDVPDWITHLALVRGDRVITGEKEPVLADEAAHQARTQAAESVAQIAPAGKVVVDLQDVGVKYGARTVLKDINWQIREGERWHLQGTNGSGKTTLLSLLTGDHPQSYTQRHLHLFSKPRSRIPTPHLHSLIGILSPELFDAFPRRQGMSAWDAVGTGFDGGFVPGGEQGVGKGIMSQPDVPWRLARMNDVFSALGPDAWAGNKGGSATETFKARPFADLSVGEQRMVLLMRALVGKAPLVLLDEVWSGMDQGMIDAARKYLRAGALGPDQAVVVITHWEEEVPWRQDEGLKTFRLSSASS
ncbi:P-loop containing nucleoside triphosphate hydrolase protein [Schizophyllum amplum]|uniref:P-loop containing nucleoside triphosphate hydrolase protein n=1 Tax=Schizophyllum amplum TaxID=97359 RepID=A0A550C570_9AGAR|nr:P-loop containing nucleoside triphosphate hydrolase protein [Auriculariopsis ampla]